MGSLAHASFEQVWNGACYRETRGQLTGGRYDRGCRECLASTTTLADQEIRGVYRDRRVEGRSTPEARLSAAAASLEGERTESVPRPARADLIATIACEGIVDSLPDVLARGARSRSRGRSLPRRRRPIQSSPRSWQSP